MSSAKPWEVLYISEYFGRYVTAPPVFCHLEQIKTLGLDFSPFTLSGFRL